LERKFATLKKTFPSDASPVKAGGWYNLKKLSGNPKEELVNMVVEGLKNNKSKIEFSVEDEKIEALSILLYAMGKGFEADLVDGDWAFVFSKQGNKSPKFQKLVGRGEKVRSSMNVFDIKAMTFTGDATVLRKCKIDSKVKVRRIFPCVVEWLCGCLFLYVCAVFSCFLHDSKYRHPSQYYPESTAYSKTSDGKIVLRRIGCDIIGAGFKVWRFPRLPLPLRKKGGYLDFVYMDKDIRVTKGNFGGLFVHFRPEFLEEQLAK
jgi:hypothetical protein